MVPEAGYRRSQGTPICLVVPPGREHQAYYNSLIRAARRQLDIMPIWLEAMPVPRGRGPLSPQTRLDPPPFSGLSHVHHEGGDCPPCSGAVDRPGRTTLPVGCLSPTEAEPSASRPPQLQDDALPCDCEMRNCGWLGKGSVRRRNDSLLRSVKACVVWCSVLSECLVAGCDLDPARLHVIPPGIDTRLWCPTQGPRGAHRVRILFVGRDFRREGGDLLVTVFRKYFPDAELLLVTEAPIPPSDNLLVYDRRSISPHDLLSCYQGSDLFVLPNSRECFPPTILNAMATGLAVVSSNVGCVPDIVEDGVTGILIDPFKEEELAAAMRQLVDAAWLRREMGREGRRAAERRFDLVGNGVRFTEVVRGLL